MSEKVYVQVGVKGRALPSGGEAGQILQKASDKDFDLIWTTPAGGTSANIPQPAVVVSPADSNGGAVGTGVSFARHDHSHQLNVSSDVTDIQMDGDVASLGSEDTYARTDHIHAHDTGLLLLAYPVGSIYMSVNSTSPAALFGGTWERIKDMFLLAAGDTYDAGDTGGEATHTLTTDELPAHTHGSKSLTGEFGAYSWGSGSGSGIVSKKAYTQNQKATDGNQISWVTYGVNATHEHDSVGLDTAHNNMPPYLSVYVWKRTA